MQEHYLFFFSSRRRHTRSTRDWSSDVCSSDLLCGSLLCFPSRYYEDSVALRLWACRRSRFCAYRTLTVCRCPFVPFQTHCLPFAKESISMSSKETWYFGVTTVRREWRMWISSRGNLGLTIPVSPCTENLRNVNVPPFHLLPLSPAGCCPCMGFPSR